jgi:ribosome-binding factor A
MKRAYHRSDRVADLLQKTLAHLLLRKMGDERFRFVTITSVQLSRDLSFAKIYVTVLNEDDTHIKEILRALNDAAKYLRHQIAQTVKLRIAPELKFIYDESTANGFRISALIDAAIKKEK